MHICKKSLGNVNSFARLCWPLLFQYHMPQKGLIKKPYSPNLSRQCNDYKNYNATLPEQQDITIVYFKTTYLHKN